MPEPGRATGVACIINIRDFAGERKRKPASLAKRAGTRWAVLSRGTASKTVASLVAISMFMLSTLLVGSGGHELVARTAAAVTVFSPPVMVNDNPANDQAVPIIVGTPGNSLFVVWQDSRSSIENPDIYVSWSLDNGTTFAPNKRADDTTGSSKQLEPAAAVSGNGTIMLVWQDNRRGTYDYDIFFTSSYDGGATFTRNVKVDDSSATPISWQERPSIAVAEGGNVYVAWTDDRTGGLRVRGAFSTDGGATFSPSEEIVPTGSTSGQTGVVVVSNGNRIIAAFMDNISGTPHPYVCISNNGGKSFGDPIRLDSTGSAGVAQRGVTIAPLPGDGVVAAWEDSRNGDWDIYACIVSAHGVITTPDFRVDDDSTRSYQVSVCVAADQLGNIYATWTDERNGLGAIRFSYLETGGTQFNASIEVAKPGGNDLQRRSSMIATEPGRVFVVWQDDKGSSDDVYSSSAYFPELFGLSLVGGWNFISVPSVGYDYRASTLGLKSGDMVAGWDSTTQTYNQNFIVGISPPSSDFAISPSTGYWVHAGSHERIKLNGTVPTSKQYKHVTVPSGGGWVIVGFESLNITRHASDIPGMLNVSGSVSLVLSYDPVTGTYASYIVGLPFTDFALVPGEAYWCWFLVSGDLSYLP